MGNKNSKRKKEAQAALVRLKRDGSLAIVHLDPEAWKAYF